MEGGNIQLPYGNFGDENEEERLRFNLPINFKKDILFSELPYVSHLKNPAIDNVIKGGKIDNLALQKYLLATDLLQDTIQENLNMVARDDNFNNASVRRELDTKYPSVMKKSNPIDAVFKDKALFDVQNPVVGSLVAQVQENKAKERADMKQLRKAPSITDINIGKRLKELNDFNEGELEIMMMMTITMMRIAQACHLPLHSLCFKDVAKSSPPHPIHQETTAATLTTMMTTLT